MDEPAVKRTVDLFGDDEGLRRDEQLGLALSIDETTPVVVDFDDDDSEASSLLDDHELLIDSFFSSDSDEDGPEDLIDLTFSFFDEII